MIKRRTGSAAGEEAIWAELLPAKRSALPIPAEAIWPAPIVASHRISPMFTLALTFSLLLWGVIALLLVILI